MQDSHPTTHLGSTGPRVTTPRATQHLQSEVQDPAASISGSISVELVQVDSPGGISEPAVSLVVADAAVDVTAAQARAHAATVLQAAAVAGGQAPCMRLPSLITTGVWTAAVGCLGAAGPAFALAPDAWRLAAMLAITSCLLASVADTETVQTYVMRTSALIRASFEVDREVSRIRGVS